MGKVSGRIPFLGMDKMWELGWISEEKDGRVVCHDIPIAFFSSELNREASGISSAIVRSRFATNSRETHGDRALLALCAKQIG